MNTIKIERINKLNVKPKFLNVMKQRIFTLMMMLALVIVAGSAMAQTSRAPYAGNAYTYSWSGVTCTTHSFSVTTTTTGPATNVEAAGATTFSISTAATSGVLSSGTASIGLTWADDLSGSTRYVWLTVNSAGGCSNYKYVRVQIKSIDLLIVDITSTYTAPGWKTAAEGDASQCSTDPTDPNTDAYDAGTTTFYFKVTRTEDGVNASASDDDWNFDLAVTDNNAGAYTGYTVTVTDGTGATITPAGSTYSITTNTDGSESYALVAVEIDNEFEDTDAFTLTKFTAALTNGQSAGNNEVSPKTTHLNTADRDMKSTPSIGGFQN